MELQPSYILNPLPAFLDKPNNQFTKNDIIKYIISNNIRILNFRYAAADGRLKTLNLPIPDIRYLDSVLSCGERVDGSSLFPYIEAGSSDLYVIPRYSTAYIDPFSSVPAMGIFCSYFNKEGLPLDSSPENTLRKASDSFKRKTGYEFEAMGELEFYVVDKENPLYNIPDQRGYHESAPFTKFEQFRCEAIYHISRTGGEIKYGHSEVGNFSLDGKIFEQNEIEFLVTPVTQAADQLMLAKWIIRNLAFKWGLDVTFAPKITGGQAGSGLHFHTRIVQDGNSLMIEDGRLSSIAKRVIAGYMKCASSLTAFGNTNPTSYLRLVPHQEAPTSICWGDRNRSVLVRVPLGWTGERDMMTVVNPLEKTGHDIRRDKQTVELRSPDGSADIYNILSGLTVAARTGLESEDSLKVAEETYVDVNIHKEENGEKLKSLRQLPVSCAESASELRKNRGIYEEEGVFSPLLIDGTIKMLESYNDKGIRTEIEKNPQKMTELVERFYHCG
ncbi:MAG: glutamine synthetase family protein [Bacteroidales bacterium]|nr:glutamine synthetase family protein [Bacteroidales bacterium]MDD2424603.1 glutamine synthetase family protein [Bacteroidales bacterium]MDD3988723.1 glutamine synthetase family protein [Bacteroidales bacterium]MDD4638574.1 glutamine synthetase family protein [Bacteroidales bacterium]